MIRLNHQESLNCSDVFAARIAWKHRDGEFRQCESVILRGRWCSSGGTSQSTLLSPYPSIVSSSKGAGLSHTGQVHVGFFSFICRKKTASKHWRWAQVKTRHGTPSRIFTSWVRRREKRKKENVTGIKIHRGTNICETDLCYCRTTEIQKRRHTHWTDERHTEARCRNFTLRVKT